MRWSSTLNSCSNLKWVLFRNHMVLPYAVCNSCESGCCQIELGSSYLLCEFVYDLGCHLSYIRFWFYILSQWVWFSLSTRSFIGSDQKLRPSITIMWWIARSAITLAVVAYLTRVNTTYRVTHLYANGIYARDELHAMNLVSWIETFIFIWGVIVQMKPMKWCNNIFWQINPANKMQK